MIIAGAAFQLLGLGLVVWGLRDIVGKLLKTLRDRTLGPKPTVSVAAGLAAGRAEAHGYVDVDIGGTTDEQLNALKDQLRQLTKTVIAHDQEMRALAAETEKRVVQERAEREKADAQLHDALRANAPLEIVGAGLIALGIVLAAAGSL